MKRITTILAAAVMLVGCSPDKDPELEADLKYIWATEYEESDRQAMCGAYDEDPDMVLDHLARNIPAGDYNEIVRVTVESFFEEMC